MEDIGLTVPPRSHSLPRSLVICAVFIGLPIVAGCGALAGEKTACDGLVYTESGLAREEYLPCVGEIMATLDQLDAQIGSMVSGDESARSDARASVRRLGSLINKAGGRNLMERWDDRALTSLNVDISNAYSHHQACMMVAGQLFGRPPLGDEKYRAAAASECRSYRRPYEEASRAYRYLR